MTVIMQRNDERLLTPSVYDGRMSDLLRFQASNGVRITDLEKAYVKNGNVRYAASLIENVGREPAQPIDLASRARWRTRPTAPTPGSASMRNRSRASRRRPGADDGLPAAQRPEADPHLYVMDKLDQDPASTCSTRRTASAGCAEEQAGRGLVPGQGGQTQTYSETLRQTLTRGLGESLNRAHEALVKKYGSTAITTASISWGWTNTNVYLGCLQPAGKPDWTSNCAR